MTDYMQSLLNHKPIKFIITGGLSFIVEYLLFILLHYHFNVNVAVANVFSFLSGLITSFMLNKIWVFSSKNAYRGQLSKYIALALINLFISTTLVSVLSKLIEPAIAKIVIVTLIAMWNYIIYKKFIFA